MNYIWYLLYGGPFNAISVGNVKLPESPKQGLKDIATVAKGAATIAALPFGLFHSCSGNNCWHTMDEYSNDYNKSTNALYPFKESPMPIVSNSDGTYTYHGKQVTYAPGELYRGEATEGFVTVNPYMPGLDMQSATIQLDKYYDKPDSIWSISQRLTNEEYNNLIRKYPQYKDSNTIGRVFKLSDFYNAIKK